jgi:S1-C subfamily serine protease
MAIGTPFGQLQGTVTVGIVSAKGRNDLNIMGGEATFQNYPDRCLDQLRQ